MRSEWTETIFFYNIKIFLTCPILITSEHNATELSITLITEEIYWTTYTYIEKTRIIQATYLQIEILPRSISASNGQISPSSSLSPYIKGLTDRLVYLFLVNFILCVPF